MNWMVEVEPIAASKRRVSMYRERKLARHRTQAGAGPVARARKRARRRGQWR